MQAIAPPCVASVLRGEWYFAMGPLGASVPSDCTTQSTNWSSPETATSKVLLELRLPNLAAILDVRNGTGGLTDVAVGTWTVTGDDSAFEIDAGDRVLYAKLAAPDCNATSAGVWRDRDASRWGCFTAARRPDGGLICPEGTDCHGAGRVQVGGKKTATRIRIGARVRPASVLVPHLIDPPPSPPAPSNSTLVPLNASGLATAINSAQQLWRASAEPQGRLQQLFGAKVTAALPLSPWVPAAASTSSPTGGMAHWPEALDWRSHRGGHWLSPPVDLWTMPSIEACPAASHAAAVLASVEARVRIASNRSQAEAEGLSLPATLGCSPWVRGCEQPTSAFLVGKLGVEFGFERRSCVPDESATAMLRAAAAANLVERPRDALPCTELPRCPSPLRRRARVARWVGGQYGGGSEAALLAELQHGPVAVGIYAEPEFAFYESGIYHALDRNAWRRMLGRTLPAYDPTRCHSGCTPPESLEWQRTNYGALLVGYGTELTAANVSVPFWTVQLPWGEGWGEAGHARILRGEASVEAAALVVEPMV